jgi:hypothetical protein
MYYNQYTNMNNNNYYKNNNNSNNQPMNSFIRVLHAAPNAPSVDIYANGSLIASDLVYKEYSDYLPVPSGNYNIRVYPAGQMNTPVINTNIFVPANSVFTIAAIGTLPDISLYPIQEPPNGQNSGEACVRFIHLSPNAPNVDIKLPDGSTVFRNVGYKNISSYVCVPGGSYTFNVTPTGTDDVVLTVPDVPLDSNNFYSIYAVGLVGETPSLEALMLQEPRYY